MPKLRRIISNFIYSNDLDLINNRYKISQDYFIIQAIFATAFTVLTGGVILSGFAVQIGASDQTVGLISLLPNIAGIFMFFSSFILERLEKKKRLVILLSFISKLMVCTIILIPMFLPGRLQVPAVIIILLLAYSMQSINAVAINIWFVSVVPQNIRGRYFGLRQMFALIVSLILPAMAGILLDSQTNKYVGFSILFSVATLMIIGESVTYKKIEEPDAENKEPLNLKLIDAIKIPLANKRFMSYLARVCFFYLMAFLSATFTSVYMLRYLNLSYTFINVLAMFGAALQMLFYRIWGRINDNLGHDFVVQTSLWFFIGEFLLWAAMPVSKVHIIMPIAYMCSAIANSGYALGIYTARYSITPTKGRSVYEGFYGAALGIVFLSSPIIGGFIKKTLENSKFISDSIQFGQFRTLYAISAIGFLVLQVVQIRSEEKEITYGE